jgi:hypothetical protein
MSEIAQSIITPTPTPSESPATTEATPPAQSSTPEAQEDGLFGARFAALSKRERKLQEQAAALKSQQAEAQQLLALKEKAKSNPMELLQHYGLTLDELLTSVLGEDAPREEISEVELVRRELEAFKAEQAEKLRLEEEQREKANQDAINEAILLHQHKIQDHVSKNPDRYELINTYGQLDLVWEVTEAQFNANGQLLSIDKAADLVESYLEKEVSKAFNANKFKSKLRNDTTTTAPVIEERRVQPPVKPSYTLNTDYVTAPTKQKISDSSSLSAEESKRRAAALLRWD